MTPFPRRRTKGGKGSTLVHLAEPFGDGPVTGWPFADGPRSVTAEAAVVLAADVFYDRDLAATA